MQCGSQHVVKFIVMFCLCAQPRQPGTTLLQMRLRERFQSFVGHLLNIDEWKEWYMDIDQIIVHPNYSEEGEASIFMIQGNNSDSGLRS